MCNSRAPIAIFLEERKNPTDSLNYVNLKCVKKLYFFEVVLFRMQIQLWISKTDRKP